MDDIPFEKYSELVFGENRTAIFVFKGKPEKLPLSAKEHSLLQKEKHTILEGRISAEDVSEQDEQLSQEILRWAHTPLPSEDETDYVYSVTDIMNGEICPGRYFLRSQHQLHLPDEKMLEREGEIHTGEVDDDIPYDAFGTVVHRVLALYRHPEDDLRNIIKGVLSEYMAPDTLEPDIHELVRKFYLSPRGKEITTSLRTRRESSFVIDYSGHMLRGTIDLIYFLSPEEYCIVDYKTSPVDASRVSDKGRFYESQVQLYAMALERIYRFPPREVVLSFLQPGIEIQVGVSEKEMSLVEGKLNRFLAQQKDGRYTFNRGKHCEWCEFDRFCREIRPHAGTGDYVQP